MVAWKGIWMGMQAHEESVRNKAEQERLERSLKMSEDRFNFDKRTQLINTALTLSERMGLSTKVTGEDRANLQLLASKVAGVEGADEWLAGFNKNPALATRALELVKKKDITGEKLMTLINVFDMDGSEERVQKYATTGDILTALSDDTEIDELIAEISVGTPPAPVLDVDPSLYEKDGDKFDTDANTYFKEQTENFYNTILNQAAMTLSEMGSDAAGYAELKTAVDNSSKTYIDPYLTQIGRDVYTALILSGEDPQQIFKYVEDNPFIQRFKPTT